MRYQDWLTECTHHQSALEALVFRHTYVIRERGERTNDDVPSTSIGRVDLNVSGWGKNIDIQLYSDMYGNQLALGFLSIAEMARVAAVHTMVKRWQSGEIADLVPPDRFRFE